VSKTSGIIGVNHVAIFTPKVREGEAFYTELFGATVLHRGVTFRGSWVAIDAAYSWDDIARRGLVVENSFMRAGGLTLIVSNEPGGKLGPINHVGIGCTEPEYRRIRELVRRRGSRVVEEGAEGFKFVDDLGVIWEITRGMDAAKRPEAVLDLGSGRMT
jgi:catechol 2,3-dioxygenase-like lactoylglutathione lyase family enzyme